MFCVDLIRICILLLLEGMFYICLLGQFGLTWFKSSISWLIFSLDDLSIVENGVLKPPTTVALLCIFAFRFISNSLIFLGAPVFVVYMFTIVTSSQWTDTYIIIEWLHLVSVFDWKFILSDVSIATPALFWFPLAWNIFIHPDTFS